MPDLLTRIADQPQDILDAIASSVKVRASEPAMRSICARYPGRLAVPDADVLEVACGNGTARRLIMQHVRPVPHPGLWLI